jgi:tetratricopeptide (TPR) repeat protein
MKKYIGKSRLENLDWLVSVWLRDGPSVCFLQGFSGVGKTALARDFRELAAAQQTADGKLRYKHAVINEIADRATPSVLESLMELSLTLSQQGLPEMEQVLFDQKTPNPAYALEKALQRPVVIVLDEAQRFFRNDTGAPLPEMHGILGFLRNRPNLPGRLLLLSDRIVEEARWSEWIPKRTLTKLEPAEALEALETKLREAGVDADIPAERKREVVHDLDCNPRAIEALVSALRYESLDEIIESNPGLWAVHDREVSRDFLKALERDLLAQAGKTDEAVALLQDGIRVIPADKNLFSLYQRGADLLAQAGKTDEAVALLQDGIRVIPADKGLSSLYQILGEVFCRAGKLEDAITAQQEGLRRIPEQFGRYKLAEAALYLCIARNVEQTFAEILAKTGPCLAHSKQPSVLYSNSRCKAIGEVLLNPRVQLDSGLLATSPLQVRRHFPGWRRETQK